MSIITRFQDFFANMRAKSLYKSISDSKEDFGDKSTEKNPQITGANIDERTRKALFEKMVGDLPNNSQLCEYIFNTLPREEKIENLFKYKESFLNLSNSFNFWTISKGLELSSNELIKVIDAFGLTGKTRMDFIRHVGINVPLEEIINNFEFTKAELSQLLTISGDTVEVLISDKISDERYREIISYLTVGTMIKCLAARPVGKEVMSNIIKDYSDEEKQRFLRDCDKSVILNNGLEEDYFQFMPIIDSIKMFGVEKTTELIESKCKTWEEKYDVIRESGIFSFAISTTNPQCFRIITEQGPGFAKYFLEKMAFSPMYQEEIGSVNTIINAMPSSDRVDLFNSLIERQDNQTRAQYLMREIITSENFDDESRKKCIYEDHRIYLEKPGVSKLYRRELRPGEHSGIEQSDYAEAIMKIKDKQIREELLRDETLLPYPEEVATTLITKADSIETKMLLMKDDRILSGVTNPAGGENYDFELQIDPFVRLRRSLKQGGFELFSDQEKVETLKAELGTEKFELLVGLISDEDKKKLLESPAIQSFSDVSKLEIIFSLDNPEIYMDKLPDIELQAFIKKNLDEVVRMRTAAKPIYADMKINQERSMSFFRFLSEEKSQEKFDLLVKFQHNNDELLNTAGNYNLLDKELIEILGEKVVEMILKYPYMQFPVEELKKVGIDKLKMISRMFEFSEMNPKDGAQIFENIWLNITNDRYSELISNIQVHLENGEKLTPETLTRLKDILALEPEVVKADEGLIAAHIVIQEGRKDHGDKHINELSSQIKTLDDLENYEAVKGQYCDEKMSKATTLDDAKELYFLRYYNISLNEAKKMVEEFLPFFENLEPNVELQSKKNIFIAVKRILDITQNKPDSLEALKKIYSRSQGCKEVYRQEILKVEEEIKELCAKDIKQTLFVTEEGKEKETVPTVDGKGKIEVYEPEGEFNLLVTVIGAYSTLPVELTKSEEKEEGETTEKGEEEKEEETAIPTFNWNTTKSAGNHGICTSYIGNDFLGTADFKGKVIYGFNSFSTDSLYSQGPYDLGSDPSSLNVAATNPSRFLRARDMIDNTRHGHNELVISRYNFETGKKIQPDYIICFDAIDDQSKKAAEEFGIPIVFVDREKVLKAENEKLDKRFEQLDHNFDVDEAKKIITTYENCMMGCKKMFEEKYFPEGSPIELDFSKILTRIIDILGSHPHDKQDIAELVEFINREKAKYIQFEASFNESPPPQLDAFVKRLGEATRETSEERASKKIKTFLLEREHNREGRPSDKEVKKLELETYLIDEIGELRGLSRREIDYLSGVNLNGVKEGGKVGQIIALASSGMQLEEVCDSFGITNIEDITQIKSLLGCIKDARLIASADLCAGKREELTQQLENPIGATLIGRASNIRKEENFREISKILEAFKKSPAAVGIPNGIMDQGNIGSITSLLTENEALFPDSESRERAIRILLVSKFGYNDLYTKELLYAAKVEELGLEETIGLVNQREGGNIPNLCEMSTRSMGAASFNANGNEFETLVTAIRLKSMFEGKSADEDRKLFELLQATEPSFTTDESGKYVRRTMTEENEYAKLASSIEQAQAQVTIDEILGHYPQVEREKVEHAISKMDPVQARILLEDMKEHKMLEMTQQMPKQATEKEERCASMER